ncbi:hypothetical protein D7X94_06845 [Acutalibacter sp. 1XD8-33]|uniref:hypothetical protein n=1 Tax=Acutalibacter sp. 1XD8-33 TaxID=2320081 RepID=UPI000EA289D5|nr:hypothetical protein [Acutalibacter sp. 1XD8-33]RKJ40768.1 hypothetical protein D7X94_06845 [Acutalibacter sp. 1XD8-33]
MARERYLVGAGEDTIHTGVIELKTARDKRKNWWHYHKVHVLVILLLLGVAASLVYTVVTRERPDYTIGVLTSYKLPEEVLEAMEERVAQYAGDRNGDGEVLVRMDNYVMGGTNSAADYQAIQAAYTRFAGDAAMNTSMIFIHDEDAFQTMESSLGGFFQYNNGSAMPEEAKDFENAMRPWEDFKGLEGFTAEGGDMLSQWTPEIVAELCGRLRISIRTAEGSGFAKDEKVMAYYQDSVDLLDRLYRGELPESP